MILDSGFSRAASTGQGAILNHKSQIINPKSPQVLQEMQLGALAGPATQDGQFGLARGTQEHPPPAHAQNRPVQGKAGNCWA